LVSTLNDLFSQILANAAIVPAGSPNGGVSVFVSNATDLVIDINGYYAPQSGITLAQGTPAAPSINFSGDSGTGIYSPGAGAVSIANGGNANLTVTGNGNVGIGTTTPQAKLEISGSGSDVAGNSDLRVTGTGTIAA
jgi:hypothetical protein